MGVDEAGRPDPKSALLFAAGSGRVPSFVSLLPPAAILPRVSLRLRRYLRANPIGAANSVRPFSTVSPLAKALGIPVNHEIGKRDMCALLRCGHEAAQGTVLICWSHKLLPSIIRGRCRWSRPACRTEWPANRFDLVWVLDRTGAGWKFYQVGQLLLPGDAPPIEPQRRIALASERWVGNQGLRRLFPDLSSAEVHAKAGFLLDIGATGRAAIGLLRV